jgi:SAM-dependent methyltransferase
MDFAIFYDKQPDYVAFRNDPIKRADYSVIVDWKVRKLVELIPERFKVGNILEVGCAFGVLLNNIADRLNVKDRQGIDISFNNIEAAKNLYPDCKFFLGKIEEFIGVMKNKIQNNPYNLLVLSDIVEHIPDDLGFMKLANGISEFVLLNLPLEKSFKTRNRIYGEKDPSGHLRCYDKDDALELVTKAGFEVIASFTSIGFFDESFYEMYKNNRTKRIRTKPFPQRIFWSVFYFVEDRLKLVNERITGKYMGTNFFALLKSSNSGYFI